MYVEEDFYLYKMVVLNSDYENRFIGSLIYDFEFHKDKEEKK